MQEPLTLYKLMILYILDSVNGPVKKTLTSECIIEQNYTDYMTAQTAIAELTEGNFIRSYTEGDCTWLVIEPDGSKTLYLFFHKDHNKSYRRANLLRGEILYCR